MSETASIPQKPSRRPWVEPVLTRHESLAALTRQNPPPGYPGAPPGTYVDTLPGSGGFFVVP